MTAFKRRPLVSVTHAPSSMDAVKIGGLDEYLVRRNQLDLCTIVHVSVQLNRGIPIERLYMALGKVIFDNLCLSLNIFESMSRNPIRRAVPSVDMKKQVEYRPEWDNVEQFIDQRYESIAAKFQYDIEEPLWRVYVINKDENILVFAFDHAVMDGSSSISIVKQLISALNDATPLKSTTVATPKTPQDKLLQSYPQTKVTIPFAFRLAGQFIKQWLIPPKKFTGPIAKSPLDSKSILRVVSADQTAKLIQAARSRHISLHVLLFTALLETVLLYVSPDRRTITLSSTVNARRHLKTEAMGNYFYNFVYPMKKDFQKFKSQFDGSQFNDAWAQEYSDALKKAMHDPSDLAQLVGIMRYINLTKYLKSELRKGRRHDSIEISNLGAHAFDNQGEYKVLELALGQPVTGINAPFCISVASVKNGPMSLVVSVASDDVAKTKCHTVWNGMKKLIDNLTQEQV